MAMWRAGVGISDLNACSRPEDELDACLNDAAEALADPTAGMRGGAEHEVVPGQLEGTQRLEPDAVGGLVDDQGELRLYPRPYVLELVAHGSVSPLLCERWC